MTATLEVIASLSYECHWFIGPHQTFLKDKLIMCFVGMCRMCSI